MTAIDRLTRLAARVETVLRETGVSGLARRAVRDVFGRASDNLFETEEGLRGWQTLLESTEAERASVAATRRLRNSLRGRRVYILGPNAQRDTPDLVALRGEYVFADAAEIATGRVPASIVTHLSLLESSLPARGPQRDAFLGRIAPVLCSADVFLPTALATGAFNPARAVDARLRLVAMAARPAPHFWRDVDPAWLPCLGDPVQFALAIAIHLGATPITLVGADCGWLSASSPALPADAPLSLASRRLQLGSRGVSPYAEACRRCYQLWHGYRQLAGIARRRGIVVRTAGVASFLDVFPRADWSELRP